jgi:hypothetical protein
MNDMNERYEVLKWVNYGFNGSYKEFFKQTKGKIEGLNIMGDVKGLRIEPVWHFLDTYAFVDESDSLAWRSWTDEEWDRYGNFIVDFVIVKWSI